MSSCKEDIPTQSVSRFQPRWESISLCNMLSIRIGYSWSPTTFNGKSMFWSVVGTNYLGWGGDKGCFEYTSQSYLKKFWDEDSPISFIVLDQCGIRCGKEQFSIYKWTSNTMIPGTTKKMSHLHFSCVHSLLLKHSTYNKLLATWLTSMSHMK